MIKIMQLESVCPQDWLLFMLHQRSGITHQFFWDSIKSIKRTGLTVSDRPITYQSLATREKAEGISLFITEAQFMTGWLLVPALPVLSQLQGFIIA
jgi:hypothetical protein